MQKPSIPEHVGKSVSERLREALLRAAGEATSEVPTALELCEAAGVSRNALYRYHRDVLEELRSLKRRRHPEPRAVDGARLKRLRLENDALKCQVSQLAALVDHYFCAWQESSGLLLRRERELASLLKTQKSRPTPLRP